MTTGIGLPELILFALIVLVLYVLLSKVRVLTIFLLLIVFALLLGFHWIYIEKNTQGTSTLCILSKSQITFRATFIKASNYESLLLNHPILFYRISNGEGLCLGR